MSNEQNMEQIETEGTSAASFKLLRRFAESPPEFVLIFALAVLGIIFWQGSPYFLTVLNIRNLLMSVAVLGLMAVPGTFLLISGNFDLSVASTAALSAVTVAMVATDHGAFVGILAALGLGLAVGEIKPSSSSDFAIFSFNFISEKFFIVVCSRLFLIITNSV